MAVEAYAEGSQVEGEDGHEEQGRQHCGLALRLCLLEAFRLQLTP